MSKNDVREHIPVPYDNLFQSNASKVIFGLNSMIGQAMSRVRIPLKPCFFQASSFQLLKIGKFTAMITLHFDLQPQFKYMNYFIYTSHHFTPHGRYELNKLASLPMCGFIAQLVEHRTGIAEVTGSNPVEAMIFSGFFFPIA